uniref:Glycosyltransferase n=1 Tax=viral metagenome TaxID=1070528 RepID=A0A6C0BA71_9ZZZZ
MKILVVVMSCHKNWDLWKSIKNNIKNDLIIFSYSPKKENWYDENERNLYLNCRDTYECLPEKIICMIDQVLKIPQFDSYTHILKIDDCEAIHLTEKKIQKLYTFKEIENNDYIGQHYIQGISDGSRTYHFGKVSPTSYWHNEEYNGYYVPWLDGGKSYIISKKAMNYINNEYNFTNLDSLYQNEIYEDLMIAKILYKYNIFPSELNYGI